MEKVIGNWKKIDRNGSVYTEELVFIDRRQCKFILINHHEYSNVTKETIFKYKINKNGTVITFTSTDPQKPETSNRFIRFNFDTLVISIRSSIYFAKSEYLKK